MTHEERVIVSAYTGYCMCNMQDVHKYIELKLQRPVFTHELANVAILAEIREKAKDDFLHLCED